MLRSVARGSTTSGCDNLPHISLSSRVVDSFVMRRFPAGACCVWFMTSAVAAQRPSVVGTVRDETEGALPGVSVELRGVTGAPNVVPTDSQGGYRFDHIAAGPYQVAVAPINFAPARHDVAVAANGTA